MKNSLRAMLEHGVYAALRPELPPASVCNRTHQSVRPLKRRKRRAPMLLAMHALLFGVALLSESAFGQHINPATGLPASQPGELTPEGAVNAGYQTANEVHQLIFSLKYEEALKQCVAFHEKWKTSGSLIPLLNDWTELGRRYPKAKTALIGIRDHDAREFKEGRGYFALFQEVHAINSHLQQDTATYELFKSFRDKDANLAQHCYFVAEDLLVAHGDYQWCYDHMGDPQSKYDSICGFRKLLLQQEERHAAMTQETQKRLAESQAQHGLTNMPAFSPPDLSVKRRNFTDDRFVGQVRRLILVLVATGHQAEAERIREQALSVLDDGRLKSAVNDAVQKTANVRS